MGKSFKKNSQHNKYSKRDRDAREKFSKKFKNPKKGNSPKPLNDLIPPPEEF